MQLTRQKNLSQVCSYCWVCMYCLYTVRHAYGCFSLLKLMINMINPITQDDDVDSLKICIHSLLHMCFQVSTYLCAQSQILIDCWLVGCFFFNPLASRTVIPSVYRNIWEKLRDGLLSPFTLTYINVPLQKSPREGQGQRLS